MALSNAHLLVLRVRGFARAPLLGMGLALSWGCSGSWFNPTAEGVRDEPEHAAQPGVTAPKLGNAVNTPPAREPGSLPATSGAPSDGPVLNPELHRLRRAAQQHVLGPDCPPGLQALPYAAENETAAGTDETAALGRFVPVENEAALEHFHQALARLAAGNDEDGKVRILAYGASHTQADSYPSYLRKYLQARFGDGGQGFVLLGRVNQWYRTLDTRAWHQKMTVHHARYKLDVKDEPLGLFGAAFVGRGGNAYGEIITAKDSPNTKFELHYYKQANGGDIRLQIDGKNIARIATKADTPGPAYHPFEASPGQHRIRAQVSGRGPVRLFGIVAETAAPGVVVDTLGIAGGQIANSLRWQEQVWADAVRHRNPDLVMFAYGTNEAMDPDRSHSAYERQLRGVLDRLRKAVPEVSCVLVAPFDVTRVEHGRSGTPAALMQVIDAQRRISREFGCGFWDGHVFMGGNGSMHRWVMAKPPLASGDHVHLTRLGYVYAGIAMGDALMRAYDADSAYWTGAAAAAAPSALPR